MIVLLAALALIYLMVGMFIAYITVQSGMFEPYTRLQAMGVLIIWPVILIILGFIMIIKAIEEYKK